MKKNFIILFLILSGIANTTQSQNKETTFSTPPSWAKSAIWYQIFVERFNNGDKSNDPKPENMDVPFMKIKTPEGWSVHPGPGTGTGRRTGR